MVEDFAREIMASALEMFEDVSKTFSRVVIFSKHDPRGLIRVELRQKLRIYHEPGIVKRPLFSQRDR